MISYINLNGTIIPPGDFKVNPDNRGFRYGDGFFETMKAWEGRIYLESFHFERMVSSLNVLRFKVPVQFTYDYIREQVRMLLDKNQHIGLARVRLMVYRGDGGIYDTLNVETNFLIQSWPLQEQSFDAGLQADVFPDARKTCDAFSAIKSNNYLCYLMGAHFAQSKGLDDAIILNAFGRVAETTIANIFIVSAGMIKTPPLTEGCINGVYRRYLLQGLLESGIPFLEEPVTVEMLQNADEVFVTNAITGIRWMKRCGEFIYGNDMGIKLRGRFEIA